MKPYPCDCYNSDRCQRPAETVVIDAKGRPRFSCRFHQGIPDFNYARDGEFCEVPIADLPPEMQREWRASERTWNRKLREKAAKLAVLLEASDARLAGVPVPSQAPVSELQGELLLL